MDRPNLESFEMVEVERHELKNAPYNPRTITDGARRKLRAGIERLGMLSPITWNKRSGFVVAGHQRLAIMDAINKSKDYRLTVAQVDLGEADERAANLLLNNPEAQGEWVLENLEAVLKTEGLNLEATGFDYSDLFRLFGESPLVGDTAEAEELRKLAEKIRAAKELYLDGLKKCGERDSDDFYLVVVFKDPPDRLEFLESLGLDDNRYQDGRFFRQLAAKSGMTRP